MAGFPVDPPRYGKHWLDLGFQGEDPAAELSDAGMLALWMLYRLHRHNSRNANLIFRTSRDPRHEFPLAAVSVNATLKTLKALRSGSLIRAANQLGDLVDSAKLFHIGLVYDFYRAWKPEGGAAAHMWSVMKSVYSHAAVNVLATIDLAKVPDLEMPGVTAPAADCWSGLWCWAAGTQRV